LNVGSLTRTPHGRFPQYHTSADNLDFVQEEFLADTLDKYTQVMDVLEGNVRYMNTNPKCEPQLGKRGLYSTMGGHKSSADEEMALLWVLNQSDGENNLLEIAERARLPFRLIREAAHRLEMVGLLTNLSY
jgi:aminopeptidase-like protein